ncbi:hypothetical protein ACFQU1_01155 [Chelatococcus sp. GCM10030263]|uniref:hypothetical protein n=1 Tax=Chelatococcus sp. GCM10030263 TaxID=3273387 RepID=UPI003608E9AD
MPFHQPYKSRFENGDLVYGIAEARWIYSELYHEEFGCIQDKSCISMIDDYATLREELAEQAHSGRRTPSRQAEFHAVLKSHPKYSSVLMGRREPGEALGQIWDDTRRKIKGGLYWASHDRQNPAVHFILDLLDMEMVVEKSHGRDVVASGMKSRSYTGVELRWIYRNRFQPNVQRCIQFWFEGGPTCPPWDPRYIDPRAAALWRSYMPRSEASGTWGSVVRRFLGF